MRDVSTLAAVLAMLAGAWLAPAQAQGAGPAVERLDPGLDALIAPDAGLERVATGFGFTEGITWVPKGGYLLLSDIPANVIYKLTPQGKASIFLDHSGYTKPDTWRVGFEQTNGKDPGDPAFEKFFMVGSNGLRLDREGRLVIATWAGRSVDRIEKNGVRTVLATGWNGKQFNGTNDLAVKKDGAIYVTDGFGGLRGRDKDPRKGLDFQGIFMIKDGTVSLVVKDIPATNGLAFSPDEKYLYANGSFEKFVRRYRVLPDDTLSDSELLVDLRKASPKQITDGMKVDVAGNIWESGGGTATTGGIWIISPEGKHLGSIAVPEFVANLEFGGPDRKTLYIAARTSVYKIRTRIAGLP